MIKKLFIVSLLAVTAVAFAPSKSVTTAGDEEVHLHNVAEAARTITWQCRNCGQQVYSSSMPNADYGCGWDMNKRHVWERAE